MRLTWTWPASRLEAYWSQAAASSSQKFGICPSVSATHEANHNSIDLDATRAGQQTGATERLSGSTSTQAVSPLNLPSTTWIISNQTSPASSVRSWSSHSSAHNALPRNSLISHSRSLVCSHRSSSDDPQTPVIHRHLHGGSKSSNTRTSSAAAAAASAVKNYKARVVEVFDGQAASNDPDPMQDAVGAILLRFADLKKDEAVLDIGTGNGSLARQAAIAVGPQGSVVALDMSPQQVKLAQSQSSLALADGGCSIFAMQADAEKVQLRSGSYNAMLCCSTLAYMSDIKAALTKWRLWLKPGGRIVFTCFQAPYDPETRLFYELAAKFGFTGVIDPLLPIGSQDQIREVLSSAGYSNINVELRPLETTIPAQSVDWYLKYMWDVSCSCPAHTLPLLSWDSWTESDTNISSSHSSSSSSSSVSNSSKPPALQGATSVAVAKTDVDLVKLAAFRKEFMQQGATLVAKRLTKDKMSVENVCTVIYVSARG